MKKPSNQDKHRSEMLESIINSSEAGVYVSDYYTGEILFANQRTAEFIGGNLSAEELIGRICWEALNKDTNKRCDFCMYKKLVDSDGNLLPPYSWERYFEEYGAWAKITNQAIRWVDGRLAQITTFHDITEMKNMQEQLAKHIRDEEEYKMRHNLQTILDKLPVAVGIADVETTNLVYANGMMLELFEYPGAQSLVGQSVLSLLPQIAVDGVSMSQRVTEILDLEGINAFEMEFITSGGKTLEARLTTCVLEYNNRTSSVGIVTDLEAEKKQQRLLKQAAEREREANRLKSSFLSNMSHEIRTPMNAIIGLTEVELRKSIPKETEAIYKKINTSAKNLLQIINDILDLSKIEANKVELFPVEFELEDVLNSAILVAATRLVEKPVELILDLSLDLPRFLIGDKTRLWQILRNLLDNAAKFTEEGSIVLRVIECKEKSNAQQIAVSFAITDTGVGMNEEQASKVFLPYEQVPNKFDTQYAGSGLGLPISKQLCELMGGDMSLKSCLGGGTVMMFSIPFDRAPNTEAQLQAAKRFSLSGLNVLIVDDCEVSLNIINGLLQSCEAISSIARSGEEALSIIQNNINFDIIILDYLMGGINGLECAKLMRHHLPESAKILILTAYDNLLEKDKMTEYGISDIIEKPVVPTLLLQKLTEIAGKIPSFSDGHSNELTKYTNVKVLVCEDVELNQEVIASMLAQFGVSIVLADNGRKGLEILDSGESIDLVLMDLHMPDMDGFMATKAIRSNPLYNSLPIISLTADAMVETLNECLDIGFNDVITKPTSFEDLQRILYHWIPENRRVSC